MLKDMTRQTSALCIPLHQCACERPPQHRASSLSFFISQDAREKKQKVLVFSHLPTMPGSCPNACLLWNYEVSAGGGEGWPGCRCMADKQHHRQLAHMPSIRLYNLSLQYCNLPPLRSVFPCVCRRCWRC